MLKKAMIIGVLVSLAVLAVGEPAWAGSKSAYISSQYGETYGYCTATGPMHSARVEIKVQGRSPGSGQTVKHFVTVQFRTNVGTYVMEAAVYRSALDGNNWATDTESWMGSSLDSYVCPYVGHIWKFTTTSKNFGPVYF